ncbi:hypothetical protein J6590_033943 [Homalodisca vitripennis]|nr:hypothetical protein J6590_033943 [Homalodisca vitripennis]
MKGDHNPNISNKKHPYISIYIPINVSRIHKGTSDPHTHTHNHCTLGAAIAHQEIGHVTASRRAVAPASTRDAHPPSTVPSRRGGQGTPLALQRFKTKCLSPTWGFYGLVLVYLLCTVPYRCVEFMDSPQHWLCRVTQSICDNKLTSTTDSTLSTDKLSLSTD